MWAWHWDQKMSHENKFQLMDVAAQPTSVVTFMALAFGLLVTHIADFKGWMSWSCEISDTIVMEARRAFFYKCPAPFFLAKRAWEALSMCYITKIHWCWQLTCCSSCSGPFRQFSGTCWCSVCQKYNFLTCPAPLFLAKRAKEALNMWNFTKNIDVANPHVVQSCLGYLRQFSGTYWCSLCQKYNFWKI